MRPQSIVSFERLMFFTLLLGLGQACWDDSHKFTEAALRFALTVQIVTLLAILGLVLLVSRGRSTVAKWISIVLFLLGLPAFLMQLSYGVQLGSFSISVLQLAAQAIAIALLFTPPSRRWFRSETLAA